MSRAATMDLDLPFLTSALPGIGGVMRATVDDFVVDELPAYEPCGDGEHTLARIEKRGLNTQDAVDRIARALGVNGRDVGYAGLKDRHARTTQWISLPRVDPARALALDLDGVRVLSADRHRNKIRTGHLRGNRFTLRVTGIEDLDLALRHALAIETELRYQGCPNYYGEQRFGRDGANASRGVRWLRGEAPPPRDRFQRRLQVSAVQSTLFNQVLASRVSRGELSRWVEGDLAMRHAQGRPWAITEEEAAAMYPSFEASASGPMFGAKMPRATGEEGRREDAVLADAAVTLDDLARAGDLAEGTRRVVRVRPEEMQIDRDGDAIRFAFTLPSGAYATVVMREFMKSDAGDGLKPDPAGGIQPTPQPHTEEER